MSQSLVVIPSQQPGGRWIPVGPDSIPVDWLCLLDDGKIQVIRDNDSSTWEQGDPVLGFEVENWTLRKPPGAGRPLSLSQERGPIYLFKFDPALLLWFVAPPIAFPAGSDDYVNCEPESENEPESYEQSSQIEEVPSECLVATPLFDHERLTEFTVGGLDGLTFFANGTFNYRDQSFSKRQAIAYTDPDVQTQITRERGGGKMLIIHDPMLKQTYRFSYHSTSEHPLSKRWYRWSTRPNSGIGSRMTAALQKAEKDSMLLRTGAHATKTGAVCGVAIGFLVLCFMFPPLFLLIPFLSGDCD